MSGTSMSTPHVTGAAALMLQAHPFMTPAEVDAALKKYATKGVVGNAGTGSPNSLLFVTDYRNYDGPNMGATTTTTTRRPSEQDPRPPGDESRRRSIRRRRRRSV